jgi:hypothetical protein
MDDAELAELCGFTKDAFVGVADDESEDEETVIITARNRQKPLSLTAIGSCNNNTPRHLSQGRPSALALKEQAVPTQKDRRNAPAPQLKTVKAVAKSEISATDAAAFVLSARGGAWAALHAVRCCEAELAPLDAFCVDGLLTASECDALVANAEASGRLSFWSAAEDSAARAFRNADTIEMAHPSFAEELWQRLAPFLGARFGSLCVDEALSPERFERDLAGDWDACGTNNELLVSRYLAGGHFVRARSTLCSRQSTHIFEFYICTVFDASPAH